MSTPCAPTPTHVRHGTHLHAHTPTWRLPPLLAPPPIIAIATMPQALVLSGTVGLNVSLAGLVALAGSHTGLTRLEASGLQPALSGAIPQELFANTW